MQDFGILSLEGCYFFNILLKVLWLGINSTISFVLTIINLKVVSWQFLSSIHLFRAHVFCIYKMLEVVVISKYKNFMLENFNIVFLRFKSLNDGQ